MDTATTTTTTTTTTVVTADTTKAKELEGLTTTFNMRSLSLHLPCKRKGLSKYFSGKARSFACLTDASCVEDLQKPELPEAKRRKYSDRQGMTATTLPPAATACRNNEPSSSSYCRPCVEA